MILDTVRGTSLLLGAASAGALLWVATTFDTEEIDGFWWTIGLAAGGGLVLGLFYVLAAWPSRIRRRVAHGTTIVAAFVPALVVGWILIATQPERGWQRERLEGWSADLGVGDFVADMGQFASVLAFGAALVVFLAFDALRPAGAVVVSPRKAVLTEGAVPAGTDGDAPPAAEIEERTIVRH